ncbi:CG31635, partial [Drosophila busckii]
MPQDSIGSDAHLDYTRVLSTVRSMCSRNEQMQAQELEAANVGSNNAGGGGIGGSSSGGGNSANMNGNSSGMLNRVRSGYYLGSRKISLTCHSRPLVDPATGTVSAAHAVTALPTPAAKLEIKRKTNARLRSPGPSPPTISPSSSPNRSRFHVSRVNEVASPLTSPLAALPPAPPQQQTPARYTSSCMSIPTGGGGGAAAAVAGSQSSLLSAMPTSSSLPSMATATSSTQTIKRLSVSPRSRFHVSRIYEDQQVPLCSRQLPPITPHTPPINLPPTPMLKSARKAAAEAAEMEAVTAAAVAAKTTLPISSVIIVEPPPAAASPIPPPQVVESDSLDYAQQQEQQQQQQQQTAGVMALTDAQPTATRARKSSWIANPTTVDKLLTLFNPSIFQRSSSPDLKAANTNNAQSTTTTSDGTNVALRKTTPPAKFNDNTAATTAAATATETVASGSSLLDTARQLRDFSKQVFRQNLSFNNSVGGSGGGGGEGLASATVSTVQDGSATGAATVTSSSNLGESPTHSECNAAHMPLSLKRELKENISPEHTINEETLHTLQKLSRVEDVTLKAEANAELDDIEIVMHSELAECMPEAETQSQSQSQSPAQSQ